MARMSNAIQALERLEAQLQREQDGANAPPNVELRLQAVRCTVKFRRSWVDLAEVLQKIRSRSKFSAWGYPDFYKYCQGELTLKPATVDKLVLGYQALERFRPTLLTERKRGSAEDDVDLPTPEVLTYLARAAGQASPRQAERGVELPEASADELERLSTAIFDDRQPLNEVKRNFDAVLFPQDPETSTRGELNKVRAGAERLREQLGRIEALSQAMRRRHQAALADLVAEIDVVQQRFDARSERDDTSRGRSATAN